MLGPTAQAFQKRPRTLRQVMTQHWLSLDKVVWAPPGQKQTHPLPARSLMATPSGTNQL